MYVCTYQTYVHISRHPLASESNALTYRAFIRMYVYRYVCMHVCMYVPLGIGIERATISRCKGRLPELA